MAELADAHGSGPCGSNTMRVQVSFPARSGARMIASAFFELLSGIVSVMKCFSSCICGECGYKNILFSLSHIFRKLY